MDPSSQELLAIMRTPRTDLAQSVMQRSLYKRKKRASWASRAAEIVEMIENTPEDGLADLAAALYSLEKRKDVWRRVSVSAQAMRIREFLPADCYLSIYFRVRALVGAAKYADPAALRKKLTEDPCADKITTILKDRYIPAYRYINGLGPKSAYTSLN